MSIQAIAWTLKSSRATGDARLVMLSIAYHCDWTNETGIAWPSLRIMTEETRLPVSKVRAALNELVRLGELVIEPGATPGGADLYRLRGGR